MKTPKELCEKYNLEFSFEQREALKEYAHQWVDKFAEDAVIFLPSHPHLHGTRNIDIGLVRHLKQQIDAQ